MKPLTGIRVIEMTHAVMGPSCGMILGDLGAEVLYIEPPQGSPTRDLKGFGSGYFPYFNRNKKSLALDIKHPRGKQLVLDLVKEADVLIENFAPGTMERLGLGYKDIKPTNSDIIYSSHKGFLNGPYEERPAMDEIVQMMGGLAYMTGPSGRPLRAGSSVVDIAGGMFGVIGVLSALLNRDRTGDGAKVKSSLFETTAFLMGQHLACSIKGGSPIPPMPERVSAWSVYQIFSTSDRPVFIGVISEKHWHRLCEAFDRTDLLKKPEFQSNNDRIDHRSDLIPDLQRTFSSLSADEICRRCESAKIPFAPINQPEDLFDDPQLVSGSLQECRFPSGESGKLPRIPLEWNGERIPWDLDAPQAGEHAEDVLTAWLKKNPEEIKELKDCSWLNSDYFQTSD